MVHHLVYSSTFFVNDTDLEIFDEKKIDFRRGLNLLPLPREVIEGLEVKFLVR